MNGKYSRYRCVSKYVTKEEFNQIIANGAIKSGAIVNYFYASQFNDEFLIEREFKRLFNELNKNSSKEETTQYIIIGLGVLFKDSGNTKGIDSAVTIKVYSIADKTICEYRLSSQES